MSEQPLLNGFNRRGIERALAALPLPQTPLFLTRLRPRLDIHVFDQVASTNQTLWTLAGARAGTVAIAHTQTAGKGQRGKQWVSSPGGVYLSVMLEPDWPAERSAHLTFSSVWGIVSQFRNLGVAAQIKWPNDIVVRGQKLGGILSESKLERGTITRTVIGVGINVCNPVPATGITWQTAAPPATEPVATVLNQVAAAVLLGIWRGVFYRNYTDGKTFTDAYQSLLTNLNTPVVLEGETLKVIGVTETGDLVLKPMAQNSPLPHGQVEQRIYIKPGEFSLGYSQPGT